MKIKEYSEHYWLSQDSVSILEILRRETEKYGECYFEIRMKIKHNLKFIGNQIFL
jgi:hypothetical protein